MPEPVTAEYICDWWAKSAGFQKPYLNGLMADEFHTKNDSEADFRAYSAGTKMIAGNPAFKDRAIYMWGTWGNVAGSNDAVRGFVSTVCAVGYKLGWEYYIADSELPGEAGMRDYLDTEYRKRFSLLNECFPGVNEHTALTLGYYCAPPLSINGAPNVDFKTHLDLQFQFLATAPECFGLYGMSIWKSRYADEEMVRWAGHLFRHYCIEGNTTLLSDRYGYKYELRHVLNADFDNDLQEWTTDSAQEGTIAPRRLPGKKQWAGWAQGRFISGFNRGNRFLWTKRCANKPNKISQTIKNLTPGKLYSMKMITADFQDWCQNKSTVKKLAMSARIEGVEMIPSRCYVKAMKQWRFAMNFGPFKNARPGFNYHWMLFRAKSPTAELTLSDWADDKTPGGPIGQEIITNFIELQPYFQDK